MSDAKPPIPPIVTKLENTLNTLLDPRKTMLFGARRTHSPYASFNQRVIAAGIDMLWAMFLLGPIILQFRPLIYGADYQIPALSHLESGGELAATLAETGHLEKLFAENLLAYLFIAPILALMWSYSSTTPGKWLLRLRIVDAHSFGKMTGRQIILRLAGYFIAMLPLGAGFWWVAIDKKKRGWHDYFAGTAVVTVKHWRIRDTGDAPHYVSPPPEEAPPAQP
jgi:uncharacterized RDD family membrane protein YckC